MDPVLLPPAALITPVVLYNWMQDSGIQKLLVDVRPAEIFDIGYIRTAISVPISDELAASFSLSALEDTLTPKNKQLKTAQVLYTHVLIYDADGDSLAARQLAVALSTYKKVRNVRILQGGYRTFAVQYPFLCSSSVKKAAGGLYPSEIVDSFLYLGSYENAKSRQQLQDLGISHIINMASELENEYPNDFKYLSVKIDDTPKADLATHIDAAMKFIADARAASSKVLVHCAMGISRSSSIVIAYLMHERGWTFEQAMEFVKSNRSCIRPNPGFMRQLIDFQTQVATRPQQLETIAPFSVPQQLELLQQQQQQQLLLQQQQQQQQTFFLGAAPVTTTSDVSFLGSPTIHLPAAEHYPTTTTTTTTTATFPTQVLQPIVSEPEPMSVDQ